MAEIVRVEDDKYRENRLRPGTILDAEGAYYMICTPPKGERDKDDDRLMAVSLITGECYYINPASGVHVLPPDQILQLRNT